MVLTVKVNQLLEMLWSSLAQLVRLEIQHRQHHPSQSQFQRRNRHDLVLHVQDLFRALDLRNLQYLSLYQNHDQDHYQDHDPDRVHFQGPVLDPDLIDLDQDPDQDPDQGPDLSDQDLDLDQDQDPGHVLVLSQLQLLARLEQTRRLVCTTLFVHFYSSDQKF